MIIYANFVGMGNLGMAMDNIELRPLSLGEMLDRAFTLYRKHFWVFVGIMAVPACAAVPMRLVLLQRQATVLPFGKPNLQAQLAMFSGWTLAFIIVFFALYAVAMGAATFAVSDAYLGKNLTVRNSFGKVRGKFWRLIGLMFNVWIRVVGLMILLMIVAAFAGGLSVVLIGRGSQAGAIFGALIMFALIFGAFGVAVWFGLRYAVSIQAVLLENVTGNEAIRRSVRLTSGRRGHIFMAVLLSSVFAYVGVIVFQGPFLLAFVMMAGVKGQMPVWLLSAMTISEGIGTSITGSFLMIILAVCYYDLRIRKEGFDLQFMMDSLDKPRPASSVTPA